ncbi:MAG TPA: hypothetical protein VHZ53_17585 [Steroidobacteraceae bacterium]|jgi:hypothetical protein|nr:hypothetical protein [Steroidobacteraceae bacterium]
MSLADREFRQITGTRATPEPTRKFKPIRLNLARFDSSWDRKRGAAARLMGVLLREDDATLERRVCESEKSAKTYAEAAEWMQRGSAYLRKMARLLDTAGDRVAAVVQRCKAHHNQP